jgi:hypothetical protein
MPAACNLFSNCLSAQTTTINLIAQKEHQILKEKELRWNFDFYRDTPSNTVTNVFCWEKNSVKGDKTTSYVKQSDGLPRTQNKFRKEDFNSFKTPKFKQKKILSFSAITKNKTKGNIATVNPPILSNRCPLKKKLRIKTLNS